MTQGQGRLIWLMDKGSKQKTQFRTQVARQKPQGQGLQTIKAAGQKHQTKTPKDGIH